MQNLFAPGGPWEAPWMERVLPKVVRVAQTFKERTIFTRFITPRRPGDMPGSWKRYYEKWRQTTKEVLDPQMLDLVPELARFTPPAMIVDKMQYSAFTCVELDLLLRAWNADSLVVTGSETDVCVLASVLGAVDRGYPVFLVKDAVCSASDEGHDAMLALCRRRYAEQITIIESRMFIG